MQLFHAQHTHDFVNKCDFVARVDEEMKQFANHEQIMDTLRSMSGVNQIFDADAETSLLVLPSALSPNPPGPCKPNCTTTHRARPEALANVYATDEPFELESKPPRKRPTENGTTPKPARSAKKSRPPMDAVAVAPEESAKNPMNNTPGVTTATSGSATPKTLTPTAAATKPAVHAPEDDLWM